ncbi:MAG: 3-deoxy-manno-octulosonate cytidylyltransferase [Candidatus Marinimicrobia bacterium CG08_land_8_20_14_0_20_45_22]|nr:MAG: 3-deoxy-manno-octulosonate cytidylyltransferase [Candidatus Marinimicrobia bacterium CG08_land_8_20_14_0_20_45_22]
MNIVGVIPARYSSTRLPGKPLKKIAGQTLIRRVYENAVKSRFLKRLIVATDDERIQKEVESFGGEAVLTPSGLPSGTDRVAYAVKKESAEIIVNIQGDEPFLDPTVIDDAIEALAQSPECVVSTAGRTNITEKELSDPNVVKVLTNSRGEAIYFSRQNIPFVRDNETQRFPSPTLVHIGLYVYRLDFLFKFTSLPVSRLEEMEKLEQLRIIENGYRIKVVTTDRASLGIDTPADLQFAEKMIRHDFR